MNLKRLLNIAQEADKNGDYVTADKVTNLLKTAQGQYSVYPNQAAYERTPQQSQQMLNPQEEKNFYNQLFQRIQNAHKLSSPYREREVTDITTQLNNNLAKYPSLSKLQPYLNMNQMNAKNSNYQIQNYEQQKRLDQIEKTKYIMGVPSSYQPAPVSTYYAPVAPGATIYTPGVVNVAQPQMTDEQKAFADLRGMKGQVYQANQVAYQNSQRPKQYPIYQTYQQPVYQGTNTQDQYNFNPNAPTNMNLYGTGYASMAMNPQLQQQQTQPPYNPQQQPQQQPQPQQQYPYNQRRNPNR